MTASMIDVNEKVRRELVRWQLLRCLHVTAPQGMNAQVMRPIIAATFVDVTDAEIQRQLDYLQERELITVTNDPLGAVVAKLGRHGFDVVEYTVDCDPGIARPPKV